MLIHVLLILITLTIVFTILAWMDDQYDKTFPRISRILFAGISIGTAGGAALGFFNIEIVFSGSITSFGTDYIMSAIFGAIAILNILRLFILAFRGFEPKVIVETNIQ